jgi:ABC-type Na+ efflux pump permease subunit
LEGVLSKFPDNIIIIGVLVTPKFSETVEDDAKNSKYDIIVTTEDDMVVKIINYINTSPNIDLQNLGGIELTRKIEDLKLQIDELEKNQRIEEEQRRSEAQDLKNYMRDLETQNKKLVTGLYFLIYLVIFLIIFLIFIVIFYK